MKIVCEACQAKYSISDDKVRGKAFKIRCKKCSHIIVVRSTSASMPVAEGSASGPLPVQDGSGLTSGVPASATENTWHIVVEGEQVGPLSGSDVRARLARGEISGETFIWREGLSDWQKVSSVAEFAVAGDEDAGTPFPSQPPTTVYPPGTAESAFAASPNGAEQDVFAAATMVSSSPSADLFASPSAAAEPAASSFSFGSAAPSESPIRVHGGNGAGGGGGGGLTGQRHENSVLFSLSNLEALASPSAPASMSPRPGLSNSGGSEGSGLIDIRSMAAMTLGSQGEPRMSSDLPTFGAPQFSPVAPVLLPIGPSGGASKWVYALIAVGLVFTLVVGGAAFMLLKKPNAPATPVATPTVATTATPTPTPTTAATKPQPTAANPSTPTTPPAPSNEVLPPREQKSAASTAGKGGKRGGKPVKGAHGTEVAAAPGAGPAPTPVSTKPEPPLGKRDKLDELLDGALGSKPKSTPRPSDDDAPRSRPAPAAAAALPKLEKGDIVKAMMGVQPKVKDCFNQYKVPGTAMMTLKVANGGRVTDATVGGKFAGTPTGTCLESAARTAKFPPSEAQTIQYPFLLH